MHCIYRALVWFFPSCPFAKYHRFLLPCFTMIYSAFSVSNTFLFSVLKHFSNHYDSITPCPGRADYFSAPGPFLHAAAGYPLRFVCDSCAIRIKKHRKPRRAQFRCSLVPAVIDLFLTKPLRGYPYEKNHGFCSTMRPVLRELIRRKAAGRPPRYQCRQCRSFPQVPWPRWEIEMREAWGRDEYF